MEIVEKIEIAMESLGHQLPEVRVKHCLQLFLLGRLLSLRTDPLQILLSGGVFAIGRGNARDIEHGSRGQIISTAVAIRRLLSKFSSQSIDLAWTEVCAIKENLDAYHLHPLRRVRRFFLQTCNLRLHRRAGAQRNPAT